MNKIVVKLLLVLCFFCVVNLNFEFVKIYAISFPSIDFVYNEKVYKYDISNSLKNNYNFNETYAMQKKYLEMQKVGLDKMVKILRMQNKSDKEILFEILPNFNKLTLEMQKDIEKEFREVKIDFNTKSANMFNFEDGCKGVSIDYSKLLSDVLRQPKQIQISTIEKNPMFTKNELKGNCVKRSSQSTSYAGSEAGRRYNLKKAMATFDGLVIMPDEIVSFNDVLTRRDDGNPYKEAVIIVNGEFTYGVGGGICQASTTIYNAVLLAGLEIVEVHRHTLPVGYVEQGFDAMVNDCGIDMKFKNNTTMPIYINTYSKNDRVFADVYGISLKDITYKKVSKKISDIEPPKPKVIQDVDGKYISHIKYKGEFYTEKYAKNGYEVEGYLYKYKGDELVSIKLVRREKYLPTQAIIYEGVEDKPEIIEERD